MSKKEIKKIAQKFQKKMQTIVDGDSGLDSVSIEVGGKKIIIARKKRKK